MQTSRLTERLRDIVGPARPQPRGVGEAGRGASVEEALGGSWRQDGATPCFVVEHRWPADGECGRLRIGDLAQRLEDEAGHVAVLSAGRAARPPFLFFDLETTGLSGGAGTQAFLVGCGRFDGDGSFATRQYVLTRFADERPLLEAVAREIARAGALVSFNGKSFDAPVLETRYLFHRLEWPGQQVPHLDVLHPARRFWGGSEQGCSLGTLEHHVLGAGRVGDVPGVEIPGRYFQFVRSGDARPLSAVLEHNRRDLLSLAGLLARMLHLVDAGPDEAAGSQEAIALGRVYARAGLLARARAAFQRALGSRSSSESSIEALRSLARLERRDRRYDAAAACWRRLLDVPGCPAHVAREAHQALAIHHEHRSRDLSVARSFALRSLSEEAAPAWQSAVRHRLARIERKMGARSMAGARLDLWD